MREYMWIIFTFIILKQSFAINSYNLWLYSLNISLIHWYLIPTKPLWIYTCLSKSSGFKKIWWQLNTVQINLLLLLSTFISYLSDSFDKYALNVTGFIVYLKVFLKLVAAWTNYYWSSRLFVRLCYKIMSVFI
jgi:hypothetical protein